MISYVECLGGEGAGPGVASRCWNAGPDEERDELLPRKMAALQPKTEGSLRRRLLSARIHQHHDAILRMNAGGASRQATPSRDKKPLPPHLQYPGNNPWSRRQHLPPQPHVHPSLAPEVHGKPTPPSPPRHLPRCTCPVLTQRSRTGSCPLTPEPRPGYTLPIPSPPSPPPSFREPEVPPQYCYRPSRSKWSVHYNTQKPQQGLLFIPGKRRSGSADDLQEVQIHGLSLSVLFLSLFRVFSLEEKVQPTSCWDVFTPAYEPTVDAEMEPTARLPTPEEKMRRQAEAVGADIVPINITGASFDRQASFRRVVSNTDSLSRRPRNLSRRKTVTGIPDDAGLKLDSPSVSLVLPGQFSTVGRPASCTSSNQLKKTGEDMAAKEKRGVREEGQSSARRIRAPRGEGMSSLMASLTSCSPGGSLEVHNLPRLATNSSLNSEASCNSPPYRTLSASSSCCQALDDQTQQGTQCSYDGEAWSDQPLSPSSSVHSSQAGDDWNSITQGMRCVSGEEKMNLSPLLNRDKRKNSTSSSSSCTRSISLRKSKRPPPPPLRSDSLRRRPARSKPPRSSSGGACREHTAQQTPTSFPQTFDDPWVPRSNARPRQSGFNCGTVTTFEPLSPDCQTTTSVDSPPPSEHLPPSELLDSPLADLPPPPPLPPLPTLLPGGSEQAPKRRVKKATPPVVTAQALQGVKLHSTRSHDGLLTSITLAREEAPPDVTTLAHADLHGSANAAVTIDGAGADANLHSPAGHDNVTKGDESPYANLQSLQDANQRRSGSTSTNQTPQSSDHETYAALASDPACGAEGRDADPVTTDMLADAKLTEPAEEVESSYWTLSGPEDRATLSESKDEVKNDPALLSHDSKPVSKPGSPEEPALPKKPDLCILSLVLSPEARRAPGVWKSNGQITAPPAGLNSQSQPPADFSVTPTPSPKHSTACTTVDKSTSPARSTPADIDAHSPARSTPADIDAHSPARSTPADINAHSPARSTPADINAHSPARSTPADINARSPARSTPADIDAHSPARSTPADINAHSPVKPPILHRKPDLSVTSPRTNKPLCGSGEVSRGTVEVLGTTRAEDRLNGVTGTSGVRDTGSTLGTMGIYGNCGPSGFMGVSETWSITGSPNNICGAAGTWGPSDTCSIVNSAAYRAATPQTGLTNPYCAGIIGTRPDKDDEATCQRRLMSSSLAEDEEDAEKERETMMMMMMMTSTTRKKDKARKRRKRRPGRQLLMMSSTVQPSPSSSSSSSSSGDERDAAKERTMQASVRMSVTGVCDEDTSDSESGCSLIGQSKSSLSSVLSTDSLQEELLLPDLLIQEPEEEGADGRGQEVKEAGRPPDADLFVSVSADQMFVSGRPRTTEDLFAVIHSPVRPTSLRSQRSTRSESFKALLLKKGSRASSRVSAVERLRVVAAPSIGADMSPTARPTSSDTCDVNTHLTLDAPASPTSVCSQNLSMMFRWRRRDHLLTSSSSSSSPFFFLSSPSMRPRSLTPPCSASRRFAARCRLYAAPMTAIFEVESEEEEEEEEDDDVFIGSPGGELSQRLINIS
ncbi:Nance-Horan syndrome protein [Collichthys lucidus]|uniref:Nance-Horan syndrome protein n=1 Tax=Collichthys lucidus TaxID=240159 RepID=A0A4U5TYD9_COLLU|nr:Nance-Horan syndrome protein [Collichthys lucidus]